MEVEEELKDKNTSISISIFYIRKSVKTNKEEKC